MSAATLQDVVDALARANCQPTHHGNDTYTARCPVHEADGHGHKPSLSVARGDQVPVVMTCHAGCGHAAILAALGIEHATRKATGKAGAGQRRIVATYPYVDADGKRLFEKVRYEPKDFRIRHRDGGAEVWRIPRGIELPLYRLPAVKAAIASGEPVYLVEGEKDADRLAAAGLCATTNYDGAAAGHQKPKWRDSYTAALAGADVVLIPDNDEPGQAHMRHVATALAGKVAEVRWLDLPGLPAKGDVSDWLNAGHTVDELKALAKSAEHAEHSAELDDEFMPIADFIASPPDNSYLVKGVLPASGLGQVFGCSHVGKSFVLIDLACHVALGWDWHGFKVKKAPVLYIAAEGVAGLKLRFRAWFQDHGVAPPPNLRIRTVPADLSAEDATAAIAERMARLPERPGLVLVDTFATNFGRGSENDAEDMNAAIAGLRTLKGDGLILTAHHTGHGDKSRGRGHSSLFAALDVEIQVTQDADKRIKVGHTKLRDGDKLETIAAFELKKVLLPWADVDGDPLHSAVLTKADIPDMSSLSGYAERLPASQRIALDALKTALVEHGAEDRGVVSVAEDQWRKAAYDSGITASDSTPDARRKAFNRARDNLVAAKKVACFESRYWIPYNRTKPDKTGHCPEMSDTQTGQNRTSSFKGCPDVRVSGIPDPRGTNSSPCSPTPLAAELATLARLDVARMLAGDLSERDWERIVAALKRLNERHPDQASEIGEMVDQINVASESRP